MRVAIWMKGLFFGLSLFLVLACPGWGAELRVTFIGNMALHITDGKTVLMTDYPYSSGAFGYMTYEASSVPDHADGLTLVTHFHSDHWNNLLFEASSLSLVAPPKLLESVAPDRRIPIELSEGGGRAAVDGIAIEAFLTPHRLTQEHYSYLVTWHGLKLFFSGDTESLDALLDIPDLDVAFVSPWLLEEMIASARKPNAKRLVVYHQAPGEELDLAIEFTELEQGEVLSIPFSD